MATRKEIPRELSIYINDREVVNSLGGITREIGKVNGQMKNLNKNSETYDQDLKGLQTTLTGLKTKQSEFKEEIYSTAEASGNAKEALSKMFLGLTSGNLSMAKEGLEGLKGSIGGLVKSTLAFVATPIGATITALAGIAIATKAWFEYNKEVAKANKETAAITKLSGDALNEARIQAKVIEETFGKPFEETLTAAKVLVNEFGISYEEALAKIETDLIKGAQYNDEYLDSIKEYSTFFAQAGYSVEEFQGIINAGFDLGIYSDKLPDALKEFSLSINEQTASTKAALIDAYGTEFTDKLLTGVKNGSITAKEALKLMADEAERVGLNAKTAQQLTADVFRGAGEDAGGALKIFEAVTKSYEDQTSALTPLEQSLKDVADSQKAVVEAQDALLQSDGFELWKNSLISTFNIVKQGFYSLVYDITNGFGSFNDKLKADAEKAGISNYTTDAVKSFEEYLKLRQKSLGEEYSLEKVRQERLQTIREQYNDSAGAGSWDATEAQQEMQKRLEAEMAAIKNYTPKVAEINDKKTELELKAEQKLRDDAAKKRKAAEEKEAKDAYQRAKDLADAKAKLAKAQLDQYILELKENVKQEGALTPEFLALHEDKYDSVRNVQKQFNDDELKQKIADLEAKAKLEKTSVEVLNLEKEALNIEYNLKNQEIDLSFIKQTDELKKQYEEEQKVLKAEQLVLDNELALAEAETKSEEARIKQEQDYRAEIARYDKLLADKKITDDEYDRFKEVARKKQEELDRVRELQQLQGTLGGLNQLSGALVEMFGQSKEMAIVQAGINGAMAVTSILAQYPKFDGGFAMWAAIAAAGITTIAQVGKIASAKPPKQAKFFDGGFTGRNPILGYDEHGPLTGLVHDEEYVIPKVMTQDPQFADTISWLEHNRQRKLNKFVEGGETSPGVVGSNTSQISADSNSTLISLISRLTSVLERGIIAKTFFGYKDAQEIQSMNDEVTDSSNNGTIG